VSKTVNTGIRNLVFANFQPICAGAGGASFSFPHLAVSATVVYHCLLSIVQTILTSTCMCAHECRAWAFYRAMHYRPSAKRGIAIACRLCVRPSVRLCATFVDQEHIGWKS